MYFSIDSFVVIRLIEDETKSSSYLNDSIIIGKVEFCAFNLKVSPKSFLTHLRIMLPTKLELIH